MGVVDFEKIQKNEKATTRNKNYAKWTEGDRYKIGHFAIENGPAATVRKFNKDFPHLNESTVREFRKKVQQELSKAAEENRAPSKVIAKYAAPTGRPLLLGELDAMIQTYITSISSRGCVVNSVIAKSAAKALIARYPDAVGNVDIESSTWTKSLFKRMGFVNRRKTSSKVDIPDDARKEIEYIFLHDIVSLVEEHKIPESLILNLDQTPSKYVPVGNSTLAKKGASCVVIAGSADKRCITATFSVTLSGEFLPMQLIYGGKTTQSIPRFAFPKGFCLSANVSHFSNTAESIRLFEKIIIPYIKKKRQSLNLPVDQKALVVMDVFTGQTTKEVIAVLKENDICVVNVPANMTKFYQPLDLTVNGYAKRFTKTKFTEWYSKQIGKQMQEGKKLEDVDIPLRLSMLKPLHAQWLVELYNEMTSEKGKEIILSGWRAAGISDAIRLGILGLPTIDPFEDLDPLVQQDENLGEIREIANNEILQLVKPLEEKEDESSDSDEWVNEDGQAFDIFKDLIDDEE